MKDERWGSVRRTEYGNWFRIEPEGLSASVVRIDAFQCTEEDIGTGKI